MIPLRQEEQTQGKTLLFTLKYTMFCCNCLTCADSVILNPVSPYPAPRLFPGKKRNVNKEAEGGKERCSQHMGWSKKQ